MLLPVRCTDGPGHSGPRALSGGPSVDRVAHAHSHTHTRTQARSQPRTRAYLCTPYMQRCTPTPTGSRRHTCVHTSCSSVKGKDGVSSREGVLGPLHGTSLRPGERPSPRRASSTCPGSNQETEVGGDPGFRPPTTHAHSQCPSGQHLRRGFPWAPQHSVPLQVAPVLPLPAATVPNSTLVSAPSRPLPTELWAQEGSPCSRWAWAAPS